MNLSPEEKRRLLGRLKRAEGQVAALRRMVEADAPCLDVLTQLSAARGALGKIGEVVLHNHVETCVTHTLLQEDDAARAETIDELVDVFTRYSSLGRE